jgi:hypothetical protein
LLAVPVRPADEFPIDDSGYGFDNVGDVLTVSPMLMEKYLAAAEKVSQLADFSDRRCPISRRASFVCSIAARLM